MLLTGKEPLTIVIPLGPGERGWERLLPELAAAPAREIVLVLPSEHPGEPVPLADARLLTAVARTGRASQMNAGAAAGTAPWLWFLHADSRLSSDTLPRLSEFIARPSLRLGYFDLRFQDDGPRWTALNAVGAQVRSRWLGLPFGDQGFVLPRALFDQLGGFDPTLASGEDHALVWRARRAGVPLVPVGASLLTSARKYAAQGWLRTTLSHLGLTARQAWRYSRVLPTP